jgi:Domain of unknown function (DUF4359)
MQSMALGQWQRNLVSTGVGVALVGSGLVATNPSQKTYETYLVKQLENRIQQECSRAASPILGILANKTCYSIGSMGDSYIKELANSMIAANTSRQDFGILSIYSTQVSVPQVNFVGKVSAIGAFNNFLIYQTP